MVYIDDNLDKKFVFVNYAILGGGAIIAEATTMIAPATPLFHYSAIPLLYYIKPHPELRSKPRSVL